MSLVMNGPLLWHYNLHKMLSYSNCEELYDQLFWHLTPSETLITDLWPIFESWFDWQGQLVYMTVLYPDEILPNQVCESRSEVTPG